MVKKVKVTGKVELTCRSRVGCRRLAVAVLNQHYDDKKKKVQRIQKLQSKGSLNPSEKNRLTYLLHELDFLEQFEHSKLYTLYFGFVEELIENNQTKEAIKVIKGL